jgi:hypothetical protein
MVIVCGLPSAATILSWGNLAEPGLLAAPAAPKEALTVSGWVRDIEVEPLAECGARSKTSPQAPPKHATCPRVAASICRREKCARARISSPLVARRAMTTGWHPQCHLLCRRYGGPTGPRPTPRPAFPTLHAANLAGRRAGLGGPARTRGSALLWAITYLATSNVGVSAIRFSVPSSRPASCHAPASAAPLPSGMLP